MYLPGFVPGHFQSGMWMDVCLVDPAAKRLQSHGAVLDIEDLVLTGTRHRLGVQIDNIIVALPECTFHTQHCTHLRMCPYYLARELKSHADVILSLIHI